MMFNRVYRLSNGKKIELLQLLLCSLIAGLVALTFWFGLHQQRTLLREGELVSRLSRIGALRVKIKDLQIDVIQVQQFLNDVSATRGLDGFDDGPNSPPSMPKASS